MDLIKDLFKGDKVIWIIFLFLCLISVVEVFSAASTLTYKSGDHWGPITQHSVILMVGAFIVVLVHNIPCKYFSVLPFFLKLRKDKCRDNDNRHLGQFRRLELDAEEGHPTCCTIHTVPSNDTHPHDKKQQDAR